MAPRSSRRRPASPERLGGRAAAASAVVFILAIGGGCRTIEGTRGIPPFYEVYESPSSFGAWTGTETMIRPLSSYEESEPERRRFRSLLPFIDFQWGPALQQYWVLPLFLYRDKQKPMAGRNVDWALFPILFGGDDPAEGSYFAVLPLGGQLKGLLGQDEIWFVAFPLYVRSRRMEKRSLHVVWPFYNEVWGGGWSGRRLWPFHGRYRSHDSEGMPRYDREFILWPFYLHHRDLMNVDPTDVLFTFPFYGHRVNSRSRTHTYFWPLYVHHHDARYDRETHAGYIFPFRFAPGHTDIWPFFGTKKVSRGTDLAGVARRTYRHYALWPIERYEWASDGEEESTRFWLLPLLWHFHYIDKDTLDTRTESKIWPLLAYRRSGEDVALDLLSPLWFQYEPYDRFYGRWFALFRYRWKATGLGGWEILYGAIMYRREDRVKERIFSILGGLLEAGSRGDRAHFRILYIPWW